MWNFKSLQKPLMALFLLCLFPLGALAQSFIKGTVKDEAGEPIIGATVKVEGSKAGRVQSPILTVVSLFRLVQMPPLPSLMWVMRPRLSR